MPDRWNSNTGRYESTPAQGQVGPKRFFSRRMVLMLAIVLGVIGVVFAIIIVKGMIVSSYMSKTVQSITVSAATPQRMVWQSEISAVGTLHAVEGADLASESAGLVTRIGFASGQDVKKGALLVQLRDDTERAAADEAMSNYKRAAALIKVQSISQSDYDSALANMRSTKAALEKKAIRAPFDGRVGIRQVDAGAYVAAGTMLVTLQQLDPIYVDFKVAQQELPRLKVGSKVTLTTDTFPGKTFTGEVSAFDPKVDETTRTVAVRATVRNPGRQLLPGMFGQVHVLAGQSQDLLILPQTAITYNTYGSTVFLVKKTQADGKDQLTVEQRFVTTGDTRGDQVAILGGVSERDLVVTAGGQKLKNATVVTIDNTVSLPNDSNPHPTEE
jgi:membrane fusion protein, multidrug efflux system